MFKKFTYRFLVPGIAVVMVACVLLLAVFYPTGKHSLAQSTNLSLAPNPANPGSTIMVTGFEYAAAEKVEAYFQDRSNGVVSATTNAGGFFNVPLTLPKSYIDGPTYVYVVSGNSTTKALLNFVKPDVTYTAPTRTSTSASFKGAGFIANEPVSFVLSNESGTVKTGTQRTDSQGRFAFALALPDMSFDSNATLRVSDGPRNPPVCVRIHYSPRIQLSSFVGPVRTGLKVTGKGFKRGETVHISFQGRRVATVNAGRNGSFVTQFNIPEWAGDAPYYHNVEAMGQQSRASASDSFQVLPSISLSANSVRPGQQITVRGSQFTARKRLQILLYSPSQGASSVGRSLKNTSVSSHGTFEVHITIPRDVQRKKVYSLLYIDVATGLNVVTYFKVQ